MSVTTKPLTVHHYTVDWETKDRKGNVTDGGSISYHTTEYHEDHNGTHTQSWLDVVHEVCGGPIQSLVDGVNMMNTATIAYRNHKYIKSELSSVGTGFWNLVSKMKRGR